MSLGGIHDRISDYTAFHLSNWNLMMGCASSQTGANLPGSTTSGKTEDSPSSPDNNEPSANYPPAEAFEISLDAVDNNDMDERSDSLIKKHPPKRIQKLVEEAATAAPPTTIEYLEEKLAKAEVRRQEYIQQKIENIITLTRKGGSSNDSSESGGNDQNDDQNDEHNGGGNASVDGEAVIATSSQDDGEPVQPTSDKNVSELKIN